MISVMGRRAVIALCFVACAVSSAYAKGKKKIQISSTPSGATVYLGSVENGEQCKTPCSVEITREVNVIVDLAGHKPVVEPLVIGRRERPPYKRSYTLEESIGNLKVSGPEGATVFLDNKDKGTIPFDKDVAAGSHMLSVKVDGKEVYATAIEVPEDEELKVPVPSKVAAAEPVEEDPDPVEDDPKQEVVKQQPPPPPRAGSLFSMSAAFSVGFRDFTYLNVAPMTTRNDLGPETEGGQVLAGVAGEIWPGTFAGVHALRGLSVYVRAQLGVNSQTVVKDNDSTALGARTFWRSFEASLHQRWVFGSVGVGVGAGYVYDQHEFEGDKVDIAKVPDANYQSLKIGGSVSLMLGALEPYISAENRIVISGGDIEDRFPGAAVNGLHGAAGVGLHFGHLGGQVEASLTRYAWTFKREAGVDTDGATDNIKQVSLSLGYAY